MKRQTDKILTRAETRIALGYTEGKIGKEIAEANNISYNTVVRHTQNIYDKADIPRSTNSLVAWFISKNYGLDLRELKQGLGSIILLCVLGLQAFANIDNQFLAQRPLRRVEVKRTGGRKAKRDDELPLDLYDYTND